MTAVCRTEVKPHSEEDKLKTSGRKYKLGRAKNASLGWLSACTCFSISIPSRISWNQITAYQFISIYQELIQWKIGKLPNKVPATALSSKIAWSIFILKSEFAWRIESYGFLIDGLGKFDHLEIHSSLCIMQVLNKNANLLWENCHGELRVKSWKWVWLSAVAYFYNTGQIQPHTAIKYSSLKSLLFGLCYLKFVCIDDDQAVFWLSYCALWYHRHDVLSSIVSAQAGTKTQQGEWNHRMIEIFLKCEQNCWQRYMLKVLGFIGWK